ncbi:hypothetical protein [Lacticaseibacillus absianus]|uniref:hypothetical protein n=1 Tax=Lacticaseibacillus absianus TaxID=2729623 RepID=UPI001FEBCA85|nr:hypothetical protein [Lacticaseibacillus absianus]
MKKLILSLLTLGLFLTGCSTRVFDQKAQLQDATTTVLTQVSQEQAALTTIDHAATAFPSTFQQAHAAAPAADLATTGAAATLIAKREAAFKRLERAQKQLEAATTKLIKINSQQNENLPSAQLTSVLDSLKLAKLDHKTFDAYYAELAAAEGQFFKAVAAAPTDQSAVDAALSRLNQYASSLSQQAEIVTANLETVTAQGKLLKQAADHMN